MTCPKCGGNNICSQQFQENYGGETTSTYREKRHGLIWWLFIGWWWWIIDIFLWIFLFIPRALLHIGRRKTYTQTSTTKNKIRYVQKNTCQSCGYSW